MKFTSHSLGLTQISSINSQLLLPPSYLFRLIVSSLLHYNTSSIVATRLAATPTLRKKSVGNTRYQLKALSTITLRVRHYHQVTNANSSIITVLTSTWIPQSSTQPQLKVFNTSTQRVRHNHQVVNANSSIIAVPTNTWITESVHALPTPIPYLAQIARSFRCVEMRALERVGLVQYKSIPWWYYYQIVRTQMCSAIRNNKGYSKAYTLRF